MADATAPGSSPVVSAQQMVQNHPTTAAAGLGGSLSIVIMSLLLHADIHLSEEEAIAWTTLITGALGYLLKYLSRRYPQMDCNEPVPSSDPTQGTPS